MIREKFRYQNAIYRKKNKIRRPCIIKFIIPEVNNPFLRKNNSHLELKEYNSANLKQILPNLNTVNNCNKAQLVFIVAILVK